MDTSPTQCAIIFAWLLCSIMLDTGMCSFKIHCNERDKHGLLTFKHGVIDPSGMLSTWSTKEDCCLWRGVNCDNITGRVTHLSLPCSTSPPTYSDKEDKSHCLTGSIHLSLLQFDFLNYLDLSNNDFLAIKFDSVDGQNCRNQSVAIPPHDYQCLNSSVLRYLDLSSNEDLVIDNLQWLSRVSSLKFLDLGGIDLHEETNWLQSVTMLPSLSELHMYNCQLEDVSPSLQYANFTTLEALDLSGNEFHSELPKWLFNLSCDIFSIHLRENSFKGQLTNALPNLPHLKSLELHKNQLEGQIPDWIGQLEHLQELRLDWNLFSGPLPTNLGNLSSLYVLCVGSEHLTGVVSERNFAKLSKLKILSTHSPTFNFDFDSHWVPPFQLEQLFIGPVGPKLPAWLYTQRSMWYLCINNSKISFEAQDKFWNFVSKVEVLDLRQNSIDGNLSNVLLNSTLINLPSNNLKGGLPRLSSNVVVFRIRNNSLSGSISPLLCDHKMRNEKNNLMYLDLSDNLLSGGLTNCWMNWKSLVHVNLGSNNLTGKIPPSMGLLSNLTSLHLHENKFFGEIPPSLQNCNSLLILNVRENNFSGGIPNWMGKSAKVLQLRSNQFNGNIPPEICQMSSLTIVDFGENRISGHIPDCLNNITALVFNNASLSKLTFYYEFHGLAYYIMDSLELVIKGQGLEYVQNLHFMGFVDLSSNDLFGTIPPQLFSLTGLQSLNLSHNKLVGTIPKEIGNMKNLESLDFSINRLLGEIPQSMSNLSFLSYLNLSFNNFTGKIPSGTQLQRLSALNNFGNPGLFGPPLTKDCSQDDNKSKDTKPISEDKDNSEFLSWFYIGIESGFVTSFLGVCCAIFLNKKWRHAYFKFLYDTRDRVYVMVFIKINSFY